MPEPENLQQVTVTRGPSNQMDEIVTRNLLSTCLDGVIYKCPRCIYSTKNPEEMIDHLATEINKSIQEVSNLATPAPKREQEK